jgi:phage terminase large subunit
VNLSEKMGPLCYNTLFAKARHKALYGGRGGGKSFATATYVLLEALKTRKRVVCARQFQNSIRDSSKELLERRLYTLGMNDQFTVTDRTITNTLNSDFVFVGLERNVESIRSLEGADIVWIEEARTISARSMETLLPTVRAAGSEMIWLWNPQLPEDPVDRYFRGAKPPPNSLVTKIDWRDNPHFHDTEMPAEMEILRQNNLDRYRHVWLGDYDLRRVSQPGLHQCPCWPPRHPARCDAGLWPGLRLLRRPDCRREGLLYSRHPAALRCQGSGRPGHHGGIAQSAPRRGAR